MIVDVLRVCDATWPLYTVLLFIVVSDELSFLHLLFLEYLMECVPLVTEASRPTWRGVWGKQVYTFLLGLLTEAGHGLLEVRSLRLWRLPGK